MKQINIEKYANDTVRIVISNAGGYVGELINTRYLDGSCDTTDWGVFTGTQEECVQKARELASEYCLNERVDPFGDLIWVNF